MQEGSVNRVIFIAGGIVLSILLGVGGLVGDFAYQGIQFDASGKAYVERSVPPIISSGSESALLQRASPRLLQEIHARRSDYDALFRKLRALGPMQSFGPVEGQSNVSLATLHGKVITAHYVADAIFARGAAQIKVRLVRRSGRWRFQQFDVYSPMPSR